MELFRNQYRTQTFRLQGYDYSSPGAYFVTLCTEYRLEYFGEIRNGIMGLNEMGCIAAKFWQDIPNHFDHVELDAWVIMPNHVHGILWLKNENHKPGRGVAMQRLYNGPHFHFSDISPKSRTLSIVIRSYKSIATRTLRENGFKNFAWQPLYYEEIIRDNHHLFAVREYIKNNPGRWGRDRNNSVIIPSRDGI